ncbi:hypothetical protein OG874_00100 [Nocardia sp. NBC_00565]|uniref:hypothetical protein n=1 Tax=Nocardia sp. NBC_00565 TaxID=2975993 RepID=UPI002E81FE0E|nr:hypothetical protein [Nocardia sp. NBC_00565]WUC03655.1 hypothetical protein OG874_00100 [Nocardia sp. NBC_00565]
MLAIDLGWVIWKDETRTVFGYNAQTLTVAWVGGVAIRARITNAAGQETVRRDSYDWQTQPVGAWVRMMLHAIVTSRPAGEVVA